ncbi:hypothetical protein Axy09_021 [Achromobacter phage vB_AxyP_19-32_Axy09]|uniref:Uncharacterized protein n=1 Tax=Achromobacter phage vB_AxyP_19-32_Axy09 TaxID=2591040 RepID=A0A514CTU0_9CAUD|nr:hypothetical protein Axy09_021 [Achromobacter phage vB_AxyP_19-32_Axy09]
MIVPAAILQGVAQGLSDTGIIMMPGVPPEVQEAANRAEIRRIHRVLAERLEYSEQARRATATTYNQQRIAALAKRFNWET